MSDLKCHIHLRYSNTTIDVKSLNPCHLFPEKYQPELIAKNIILKNNTIVTVTDNFCNLNNFSCSELDPTITNWKCSGIFSHSTLDSDDVLLGVLGPSQPPNFYKNLAMCSHHIATHDESTDCLNSQLCQNSILRKSNQENHCCCHSDNCNQKFSFSSLDFNHFYQYDSYDYDVTTISNIVYTPENSTVGFVVKILYHPLFLAISCLLVGVIFTKIYLVYEKISKSKEHRIFQRLGRASSTNSSSQEENTSLQQLETSKTVNQPQPPPIIPTKEQSVGLDLDNLVNLARQHQVTSGPRTQSTYLDPPEEEFSLDNLVNLARKNKPARLNSKDSAFSSVSSFKMTPLGSAMPIHPPQITDHLIQESETAPNLPILDTLIGSGSYSKVYQGKYQNQTLAIKLLDIAHQFSYQNELRILKILSNSNSISIEKDDHSSDKQKATSSNVIKYITAGNFNSNKFYIGLKFYKLGNLLNFLQNNFLVEQKSLDLIYGIANGIDFLHNFQPRIAHGDLKPGNILLKRKEKTGKLIPVISDFGLATIIDDKISKNSKFHVQKYTQKGTFRYMSPELMEGCVNFTDSIFFNFDVYAFGLIGWEILSRTKMENYDPESLNLKYKVPFESELGRTAHNRDVMRFIVKLGNRPKLEKAWLEHERFREVCLLLSECWDVDSEARPSSGGIKNRLENIFQICK